LPPLSNA